MQKLERQRQRKDTSTMSLTDASEPRVWVVLVNWNGFTDTLACLKSLADVDYPSMSVVVVDNGSCDNEAVAIKSAYPKVLDVTVIELCQNIGFAGGNNVGIQHALKARADYVLCLNNDTVVAPDFLDQLVKSLEDNPDAGLAVSKIFFYDRPDDVWFLTGVCAFSHRSIQQGCPAWHEQDVRLETLTEPVETGYVCGCAALIRSEVLRELGGFDERYFAYCEDVDLSLRAAKLGWRLLAVPASHVWHKISRSSGGAASPSIIYYCVRNTWLLARSYAPGGRVGALKYYYSFTRQQLRHISLDLWSSDNSARSRVLARLSAICCACLGLFGNRQDHARLERMINLTLSIANIYQNAYWSVRSHLLRVYWFLHVHIIRPLAKHKSNS